MILFEKVWGMDILDRFPGVITFRVPFPFHEVLELSRLTLVPVIDQMFDLIFLCSLN